MYVCMYACAVYLCCVCVYVYSPRFVGSALIITITITIIINNIIITIIIITIIITIIIININIIIIIIITINIIIIIIGNKSRDPLSWSKNQHDS